MTIYDQLSFQDIPKFYLTSSSSGDVSLAGEYTVNSNNLSANANPIIAGSKNSYSLTSSSHLDITNSFSVYQSNTSIEFVAKLSAPSSEMSLLVNPDNNNGLYLSSNSIYVKMYSDDGRLIIAQLNITNWDTKKYVRVQFSDSDVKLYVNGVLASAKYTANPLNVINHLSINTLPSGFTARIDGLGIYYHQNTNKSDYVDDRGQGYHEYSSKILGGRSTLFDNIRKELDVTIGSDSFATLHSGSQVLYYKYYGQSGSYMVISCDNVNAPVYYSINNGSWSLVTNPTFISLTSVVNIGLICTDNSQFNVRLTSIQDGNVSWHSPASMTLAGLAYPPRETDESIVNIPQGLDLSLGSYSCTWNLGQQLSGTPSSIEIVFMPLSTSTTYVFSSSDGSAIAGTGTAITGYTAYLNGVLVTDLSAMRLNQWNHLVLNNASGTATSFYLNTNASSAATGAIKYMLLGAYGTALNSTQITQIYNILLGIDVVEVDESVITLAEGAFSGGSSVNIYSYAWAIQGAGG